MCVCVCARAHVRPRHSRYDILISYCHCLYISAARSTLYHYVAPPLPRFSSCHQVVSFVLFMNSTFFFYSVGKTAFILYTLQAKSKQLFLTGRPFCNGKLHSYGFSFKTYTIQKTQQHLNVRELQHACMKSPVVSSCVCFGCGNI